MWTVLILNFPCNLLILHYIVCWNSTKATPIGPSLCHSFVFFIHDSAEGCGLHSFWLSAFLKCRILSLRHSVSHIVLAWLMSVVSTACFGDGWWGGVSTSGCPKQSYQNWVHCVPLFSIWPFKSVLSSMLEPEPVWLSPY
jgi:hypothetical protein